MTTREAIEAALVENPDDLASHAAYADLLHEQGDPRGDLIQVQLALEDPTLTPARRKPLAKRETELLKEHEREWLGPLAPFLLDNDGHTGVTRRFARGWVASLTVPYLTAGLAAAIASGPLKLLTELHLETAEASRPLRPLAKARNLAALRVLKLGKDAEEGGDEMMFPLDGTFDATDLPDLVARLPHLAGLHLWAERCDLDALFAAKMPALRALKVYHLSLEYPLHALAANASLGSLAQLLFQPHMLSEQFETVAFPAYEIEALGESPHLPSLSHLQLRMNRAGDEGVRALAESGLLARLAHLDLSFGMVTDRGARLLADTGELPNLRRLDLSYNRLTDAGRALLTGRPWFHAAHQWEGDEAYFEVQFE